MMGLVGIAAWRPLPAARSTSTSPGSLLWGKLAGASSPKFTPIAGAHGGGPDHGSAGFAAPGTFVLAMVFLVAFVLYYFINWKYLSRCGA
jgi:cytochrome c oxidase subunit 1